MLASLDEPPVAQRGLIYEPKYDGIRALVDLRPPARLRASASARQAQPALCERRRVTPRPP